MSRGNTWVAGAIALMLMIALPLLERYLRGKSCTPEGAPLGQPFYDELRSSFPALTADKAAREFWQIYRNGLLHEVALSQADRRFRWGAFR